MRMYYTQVLKLLLFTVISIYSAEQRFDSEEALFIGMGNAPTIQLPQLTSSHQLASTGIFAHITTLDLSHETNLDASRIHAIAALYPNVEELTIAYEEAGPRQAQLTREFAQALVISFPNLRSLTLVNVTMHWAEEDAKSILQNWQEALPDRKLNLQVNTQEPFIPGPESGFSFRERLLMDPYAFMYHGQ